MGEKGIIDTRSCYVLKLKISVEVQIFSTMPSMTSKKNARQGSAQDLDNSPSTSLQKLDTEKSSLTDEEISERTQQIEW